MATFSATITPYDLDDFADVEGGLGWTLECGRAALLVHDVLPYYLKVLSQQQQEDLTARIDMLVGLAARCAIPVIASAPRPANTLAQRGVGGRLWGLGPSREEAASSAVDALPDDTVWIGKRSLSAFYATDLDVELRRCGRDQLVIVGVFASGGVVATTFDALARDVEVFVVADAVADYDKNLHGLALAQAGRSTGEVISTQTVISAWDTNGQTARRVDDAL